MKVNYKELDFDNFVQIFNTEGIEAAKAFVSNNTTITYRYFTRLLSKHTNYVYNKVLKKYETSNNPLDTFLSMDDLIHRTNKDATETVASIPEKIYYKDPIDSMHIDIFQDRLMEISKYIVINQSAKTIKIDLHRLRDSGYDISIIE